MVDYCKNEAGPNGEDIKDTQTISAVDFIWRYLQHVMPKGLGRGRFYGWWSSYHKGKTLPLIRVQLGVELEEKEEAEEEKKPDDDKDETDDTHEPGPLPTRQCPKCKEPTLVRQWKQSMPRLYDLMQIVIWPQQEKTPRETQALLPELETWLPGGDAFLASVRAQFPPRPASGFT